MEIYTTEGGPPVTREGILAASEIDQFQPYLRERILLTVQRLAELYHLLPPPKQPELPLPAPAQRDSDIIVLSERRRAARER